MASDTTLVLGIGNTLLSDEGVGVFVVEHLQAVAPDRDDVRFLDGGTLSFTLAEAISACARLVVVDAARLAGPPGSVAVFEGEDMDRRLRGGLQSVHEVSLSDLLDIARLTDTLPERRALVGIEPASVDWGDGPTAAVAAAVPRAARAVLDLVDAWDAAEVGGFQKVC